MTASFVNVLIVEDEADVRELIKLHLSRESYLVDEADDAIEALEKISHNKYDLIVLDWMLPSMSGLDVCKEIRKKSGLRIPILMVTARADTLDKVVGLEIGADDYLTKPFEVRELVARAKALVRRSNASLSAVDANGFNENKPQSLEILKHGPFEVRVQERKFFLDDAEVALTAGELRMMEIFIEHKGKSLEREWLIKHIQGTDVTVVDRAIDTRILGLRKKLGKYADWIETVRGHGYRLKGV